MKNIRLRNVFITMFVIVWTFIFHYESLRQFYLNPLFKTTLPKIKFLFPPAGWIMFYRVDDAYSFVNVYGIKDKQFYFIDPHDIFQTRTIGFDNIHRGIMGSTARKEVAPMFCGYLKRKFSYYDRFAVMIYYYPSLTENRNKVFREIKYQCVE